MNYPIRCSLFSLLGLMAIAMSVQAQSFTGTLHINQGAIDRSYSPLSISPITFSGIDPKKHDSLIVVWSVFDQGQSKWISQRQNFEMQQINAILFSGRADSLTMLVALNSPSGSGVFILAPSDSLHSTLDSIIFPDISPSGSVSSAGTIAGCTIRCFPNPAHENVTFEWVASHRDHVQLRIYDVNGRLVRNVCEQDFEAGTHRVSWNGRNSNDDLVPNGAYILSATSGEGTTSMNITIAR